MTWATIAAVAPPVRAVTNPTAQTTAMFRAAIAEGDAHRPAEQADGQGDDVEQQRSGVVDVDARADRRRRPRAEQRMVAGEHVASAQLDQGVVADRLVATADAADRREQDHEAGRRGEDLPSPPAHTFVDRHVRRGGRGRRRRRSHSSRSSRRRHPGRADEDGGLLAEEQQAGGLPATPAESRGSTRTPNRFVSTIGTRSSSPFASRSAISSARSVCELFALVVGARVVRGDLDRPGRRRATGRRIRR